LAFPVNDFGLQEPGTSISFPLFTKISVTGKAPHPLYQHLTEKSSFPRPVTWNFQKYLVDRSGNVTGRYDPGMDPLSPAIRSDLEKALARG
jgi:glutathione peroxidase